MATAPKTSVGGTVDAFNFIRRVGFPTTPRVIEIFAGIALLSASISLLPSNESLAQTLVFVVAILVWPAVLGEFLNAPLILHKVGRASCRDSRYAVACA